jgi:UDP-N-acetylglucosamine/UDP-N-acetylgalactosamine diphosphorylase
MIEALTKGQIATVVLAGGLGSRLGSDAPKGTYPISQVKGKSLFQLIAEKTLAAGKAYGTHLQIAIMTSQENHDATVQHFTEANFFGLSPQQLSFFTQGSLPLLDDNDQPVLTQDGSPLTAPDGNGLFFQSLAASGILDRWKRAGITCITVVLIDNPLADPFYLPLIALHLQKHNAITLAAVERLDPEESVGLVIEKEGKLRVVEYSEISHDERYARDATGRLKYPLANISFFAFSLAFIEEMAAQKPLLMPLHRVKKELTTAQKRLLGKRESIKLWKSEYFIFDLLSFTNKSSSILLDREDTFCPLKNSSSVTPVQKALLKKDQKQFYTISHVQAPPDRSFELSQQFYYPTEEIIEKWKNRPLPSESYIEP